MSKGTMRAGAQLLMMATDPINRGILRTVLERPVEMAPGQQLPGQQRRPRGALRRLRRSSAGCRTLRTGPLAFDGPEAEATVAALAEGWSATVVHMLAREPMTLRELDDAIDGLGRRP